MSVTRSEYLNRLQDELKQACPKLVTTRRLEFRNCFGAVAAYVDGKIFVSHGKFGIALRLPPDTLKRLSREPDVLPLKYFPNGHVKKEYAIIPKRIIDQRARFRGLVAKSIQHALGCGSR